MPTATSPSAMPWTSNGCRPQNSAIWSKVSAVLLISHTAVAFGISGFAINHILQIRAGTAGRATGRREQSRAAIGRTNAPDGAP